MKYIDVKNVVNAYNGLQNCMTNKSWGYLALLKGCNNSIRPSIPYEVDMDIVSNFLENIFNLSQEKRQYKGGRSLYVVFSNKWEKYFNYQGRYSPNIYDVVTWAYRRKAFSDNVSKEEIVEIFSKEFNIPFNVIANSFNVQPKEIAFADSLYPESVLKSELSQIGVVVTSNNIDSKGVGVVASPGEITRGPFIQTLYAGLDITDYVLILQSSYNALYGNTSTIGDEINKVVASSLQKIFYGAPGTGKSHQIKEQTEGKQVVRTTFHPDSDYSTFVGAYKPTSVEVSMMTMIGTKAVPVENPDGTRRTEKKIVYEFVPQAFLKAYTAAWKKQDEPYFLIIEEINRGNCAQIFGDLFQLLDRNDAGESEYPVSPDDDIRKFLQTDKKHGFASLTEEQIAAIPEKVRSGEELILPRNLYIWATMNTSDQSLFPIDSAFKRRWDWQYIPISDGKKDWEVEANGKRYDWWEFLQKINDKIGSTTNSEDKKLGYFFCKAKNGIIDAETFVGKVIFYVWNDVFKDFAEEAGDLFRDEDNTLLSFNKFYAVGDGGKTEVLEDRVTLFMQKLGVEPVEGADFDEDDEEIGRINKSSFVSIQIPNNPKIVATEKPTQFDTFVEALKIIGIDKIIPIIDQLKYQRLNSPVISTTKYPEIENDKKYSYHQEGGLYIVKGCKPYTYVRILEDLDRILNIGLSIETK